MECRKNNLKTKNTFDDYINIPFTIYNLDRYYIRTSIFSAVNECIKYFKGRLLDVGCGKMPYKDHIISNSEVIEYIGLDIETALEYDKYIKPDYKWDGNIIPFDNESFNTIIATEVLEHCQEPSHTINEMYRVLKKEGFIFLTVPYIWPLHEVPHDEYRYTPFSLKRILFNAGFNKIEIKSTGGWHASLAQMLGLWVRRSGLSKIKKSILSVILKPFILYLIKKDKPSSYFYEGLMIPNIYLTAIK